ncbi:DUF4111 domain-containing protein [Cohnella terricola]|uniref:Spectinomycin 9-adenylyltransferase n=2 Tax=Cohnella terricola TaxID=1289167 RepID=A0A559J9Z6_9BACL|nr:DUF4111 domain-containing protein [Cohnella terricola]
MKGGGCLNTQLYLDNIVSMFKEELRDNLSGIYLHGSLAMGCFNPHRSDIDFIVVVKESLTSENKKRIAKMTLMMNDKMPNEKGLEFSVILEMYLMPFVYPTPCEFHYSDFHKERYRSDENYLWGGYEDSDLASQLVVAYHRGIPLYGRPLNELYQPIERQYFLASILHDIEGASQDIFKHTMYLTLNLCRVLFFLKEGDISSKKEGGEWGAHSLPNPYRDLVMQCLEEYTGNAGKSEFDNQILSSFAEYMLHEINRLRL